VAAEKRTRLVCERCRGIEYLNPKLVACTIPLWQDGILLVRRGIDPGFGKWVFPGGYVDLGESVRDAAVREAYEEAGVRVEIERILDAYSYTGSAVVVLVYVARVVGGEPAPGDECLEVRAFAPDQIPWEELAFPSTRDALRDYLRQRGEAAAPGPGAGAPRRPSPRRRSGWRRGLPSSRKATGRPWPTWRA
jgi:ADP-ribose pyrophosphatase YjhB (NUDIX family)